MTDPVDGGAPGGPAPRPGPADGDDALTVWADRDPARWGMLALVSAGLLLGMGGWFTASAVAPELQARWSLTTAEVAWLTTIVQLGFVTGTATAAVLNLADIVSARRYFAACALLAAAANAAVLLAPGYGTALGTRFATGFFYAGVYPPGMKMIATWFRSTRGLAIGTVVGALALGKGRRGCFRAVYAVLLRLAPPSRLGRPLLGRNRFVRTTVSRRTPSAVSVRHFAVALLVATSTSACAGGSVLPETGSLRDRVAADASDDHARLMLAARWLGDGRPTEADSLLAEAPTADRPAPELLLMRALAADAAGRALVAVEAYERALQADSELRYAPEVAGRLRVLAPAMIRARMRAGGDADATASPVFPGRVVVLPFATGDGDADLAPLAAAARALLMSDLSATGSLSAVARERVDAATAAVEPDGGSEDARAAAVGSLLRAEWAVTATLSSEDDGRLRLRARLHPMRQDAVSPHRTFDVVVGADAVYDAGKSVSEDVYAATGHPLSEEERLSLGFGQTRRVDALTSFGLGLLLADAARYEDARDAWARASALSPGFRMARVEAEQAGLAADAPEPAELAVRVARAAQRRLHVAAVVGGRGPSGLPERASLAELLGRAGIDARFLDLVIVVDGSAR